MSGESGNVRAELERALVESAKRIVLERVDEGTLLKFLYEEAGEVLRRLLESWNLRRTIEEVMTEKLRGKIDEVIGEILERDEFKDIIAEAAKNAFREGIQQGTKALKERLSQAVAGRY